ETRPGVVRHEGPVGNLVDGGQPPALTAGGGVDALGVQDAVDLIGSGRRARMQPQPDLAEADVVLAAAQRAWPMAGGECGRLVEEEELGETPRLHERRAVPAPEPQPAGDPAAAVEAPADAAGPVVQAAAIPVDQAAS